MPSDRADERTDVADERTDVAGERTDVADERTDVAGERTDVAGERSEATATRSEPTADRSEPPRTDEGPSELSLAIETQALTKRYGDVDAVVDLDLAISPGVVYGFLGPNGSGKTTTMRMLTTLTRPSSGDAFVCGDAITDRDAVIDHVGYLPESPPVFEELTARENLRYVASLHDIPRREADDRIDRYLDRFGLAEAADRRVEGYSKGMRQKLGLVQAIIHDPDVIFLDEPTSGLDPRAARTVKDLIAELADRDVTIFLSTHILSVVDELADTVGVLHDGRLVAEGSPADLKTRVARSESTTLEDAFLQLTDDHDDHNDHEDDDSEDEVVA